MAMSTQVKEAVEQASKSLRDALAFAARSEHPVTIGTISDLLMRCESVESMDEIMNKYGRKAASDTPQTPGEFGQY